MSERHTLLLRGCQTTPLAGWLKALGALRIVAEQHDPGATGRWTPLGFALTSTLDLDGLVALLAERWAPSPVVCPWNGDSGFHPEDGERSRGLVQTFAASTAPRCAGLRAAIVAILDARRRTGMEARQDKEGKTRLLQLCRAWLPDDALSWFDAAVVLLDDDWRGPPLLGTGGNDGRLDFGVNFMDNLLAVFDPEDGAPRPGAAAAARAALTGEAARLHQRVKLGQFDAAREGNPWDYLLAFEGALLFAAAALRRLGHETRATAVAPFTVEATAAGYGSAVTGEESDARGELWLPVWEAPTALPALRALFAAGRIDLGRGRAARDGLEVARALAASGVDRGLTGFERFGLLGRNGKAYLAVPLGRWRVRHNADAALLGDLDRGAWRRRLPRGGAQAPERLKRAVQRLDEACMTLCREGGPAAVRATLTALGAVEALLALGAERQDALPPCPPLGAAWAAAALREDDEGGAPPVEATLAAALSSLGFNAADPLPLRAHLEPVTRGVTGAPTWDPQLRPDVVWRQGDLTTALLAVLQRRVVAQGGRSDAASTERPAGDAAFCAPLRAVEAFLLQRTDDALLEALLRGFALVRWRPGDAPRAASGAERVDVHLAFALLKLTFAGHALKSPEGEAERKVIPIVPALPRLLERGDAEEATRLAARRLRGSNLAPRVSALAATPEQARRFGAALLFPLSMDDVDALSARVLIPPDSARR